MHSISKKSPFADRSSVAFLIGGVLAAVAAGVVFTVFFQIPDERDPRDHRIEALFIASLVMFFCGGFVGLRAFSADKLSELIAPTIGTHAAVVVTMHVAAWSKIAQGRLPFLEFTALLGCASVGVAASVSGTRLLIRWFPARPEARRAGILHAEQPGSDQAADSEELQSERNLLP